MLITLYFMRIMYCKLTEFCDIALSQYVHQFKSVILSYVFKQKKERRVLDQKSRHSFIRDHWNLTCKTETEPIKWVKVSGTYMHLLVYSL